MTFEREQTTVARKVTITGTRSIPAGSEARLLGVFNCYLQPFAAPDAHFYLGGAIGIDTAALDWLADRNQAWLTVVVPCAVADQPAAAVASIRHWQEAGRLVQVVELGAGQLGNSAYHARNRWMVDRSGFVIGFPRDTDPASGTWYTVNYAADQGKPRLVIPI